VPPAGPAPAATLAPPAGAAPATPIPLAWGPLRILEKIGEGVYGEVFRAFDPRLAREVALKLLRPASARTGRVVIEEGRLLARVRHPHVATVHGAEEHDGRIGIWMEFVSGRTLEAILREQGTLGAREAAGVGIDLCRALAAVHAAGIVHRDLKAQNVLRESGGRIVLADFGAGFDALRDDGGSRSVAGSPLYLAPETLRGDAATTRSDLYALGVLLHHLVTGDFPVSGRTIEELREAHGRRTAGELRGRRPDLPSAFVEVVERALASDPRDRFGSAGEMEAALGAAVRVDDASGARVARGGTRASDATARWLAGIGLAAAAAVLVWIGVASLDDAGDRRPLLGAANPSPEGGAAPDGATSGGAVSGGATARLFRRAVDGAAVPLVAGDRVALGDRVFLELDVDRETWAYVANEDARGEAFALWPQPTFALGNPLPPGRHRLPDSAKAWEFTSEGGEERILVLTSDRPIPAVEDEFARLAPPSAERTVAQRSASRRTSLLMRGLGGVADDAFADAAGTLDPIREEARRLAAAFGGGAELVEIRLENPPRESP
jgi:serine/threonine-protein kinase